MATSVQRQEQQQRQGIEHGTDAARSHALLAGVAKAAQRLLAITDFDAAVNEALEAIARATNIDRIYILENHTDSKTKEEVAECPYERTAAGVVRSSSIPGRFPMPYSDFGDWLSRWKGGEAIQALARDLSESAQELQEKDEARSLLTVPIFVETHLWGVVGFDDCTAERVWGESEIAVLETAAACIASAIERDRTQKEKAVAAQTRVSELAERDRILEATAAAANVMLTDEDFDSAVNKALRIVGEGLAVDRINLGKYFEAMPPQNTGYHHFLYEWDSDNTVIQTEHPELAKIPDKGIESAVEAFRKGEVFGGIIDELPEPFRSAQIALGVKSTYAIPIRIQGRYWGVIAFDDCHQQTRRSEAELEALMALANCIGSAISREQTQKEREAAERKVLIATERAARAAELEAANQILITRDRWLQTTAVAASELLSTEQPEISVNAALKTIGENLSCDRVGIMRHLPAQKGQGSFRVLYEWDSSGTPTQIGNNDLVEMPASDFADWTERLIAGESIGGLISEQQEPFRSKLQTLGTVFAYAVPIFIDAEFWGLMFMDYCREVRQLTSAELAVFDTTATCVGSAIHRAQIQRDRLQAERSALIEREREKAARDRATELAKTNEALNKTLNALTETPEPDEFLGQILASICQHIEACTASLFLYDETTHTLNQHLTVQEGQTYPGTAPTDPDMFRRPIPADLSNGWKAITESKKPFTVDERHPENDALMWPESVPWHQEKGHLSATCACMRVGNKPIGFIGFAFRHLPTLSDEQLEFIQSLTNQATLSIHLTSLADEAKQNAILQEQEKAASQRAAQLASSNESISKTLTNLAARPDLDEFLGYILAEMSNQLEAGKVHLFLYDAPTHTLSQRVVVQDGKIHLGAAPTDPEILHHPIPADLTPAWETLLSSGEPLTYDETIPYDKELWWPETIEWHQSQGHKAVTCIPMKAGDQPIGYIGFCFYNSTIITDEQQEFMQALANQAIVAIQLTRLAEEAKQTAILQEQEKAARDRVAELAKTNEALGQTLSVLTTTPELDDFLGQVLCKISEPVQACKALLFLYSEDTHTLHAHLSVHDWQHIYKGIAPNDPEMFYHPIPADISPAWARIIKSSKPWTLDEKNPADADLWWPESMPWNRAEGHCAATCAVMKVGGKPIGFIALTFHTRPHLTNEQLEFIQALTNQATLAIHLTRLAEQGKTAALSNALTNERNRLAREIHDTLAQSFTGVSLQLEAAKAAATEDFEGALYHIGRAGNLARRGLSEARRSVRALRSHALETDTLPNALRTALVEMTQSSPTQANFVLKGTPHPLPEDIQTNLLRIGQEATTNALRHAQASTLTLTLEFCETHIRMTITDDGQGCHITSLGNVEGFGLVGMRERVHRFDGQFSFNSTQGSGTVIAVSIPIDL